jgi:hypothetical protein
MCARVVVFVTSMHLIKKLKFKFSLSKIRFGNIKYRICIIRSVMQYIYIFYSKHIYRCIICLYYFYKSSQTKIIGSWYFINIIG